MASCCCYTRASEQICPLTYPTLIDVFSSAQGARPATAHIAPSGGNAAGAGPGPDLARPASSGGLLPGYAHFCLHGRDRLCRICS